MNKGLKKLTLHKETIRLLQDSELRAVAGGLPAELRQPGGVWAGNHPGPWQVEGPMVIATVITCGPTCHTICPICPA